MQTNEIRFMKFMLLKSVFEMHIHVSEKKNNKKKFFFRLREN